MGNEQRGKDVLVVDIGSYSLKVLIGKSGAKGIVIHKALTVPLSANIYANGDIQNQQELISILSEIVRANGMRNHPAVVTFSSTSSFARVLEVPAVRSGELKNVIDYEMQQYLPADASAFIIQHRSFPGAAVKPEEQLKVIVGVVPRIVAENIYTILKSAELVPAALDIHPNALNKLVDLARHSQAIGSIAEENVALIDLGHTLMDINVFEKGEFQFNRRILMGGKNIDQRIERVLEVSIDDARMEKHNNSDINQEVFDYTDENRVFNSVKTGVDEWVSEIEKVVRFYTSRKTDNRIDRCLIYGGGAGISGIERYLTANLSIRTEVLRELPGLVVSSHLNDKQMPLFINALGALVRGEGQK